MPALTAEQLESIKAANHAASVAWEAATFKTGDVVLSHGYTARRSAGNWICTKTGTEYTTLSRFFRHKLARQTFNVKRDAYLVGPSDRPGIMSYTPVGTLEQKNELIPPAASENKIQESRVDELENRLALVGSVAADTVEFRERMEARLTEQQARIVYLEERLLATASVAAHAALLKGRIEALENRLANMQAP